MSNVVGFLATRGIKGILSCEVSTPVATNNFTTETSTSAKSITGKNYSESTPTGNIGVIVTDDTVTKTFTLKDII